MTERLTTLAIVKDWLGIDTTDSDSELIRIIDAASQFALNYLNRDSLAAADYTQNFKGNGKDTMLLRNWPVLSVASVGINGSAIVAGTRGNAGMPSTGFFLSDERSAPQSVDLFGYNFWYRAPCQVVYRAGYEVSQTTVLAKTGTAPDEVVQFTPTAGGQWIKDVGVTIDGVPAIKADADPATGEYSVAEWGTYTFALADDTKTAVITYAYAPWDIAQGVVEIIGEWFKRKDRIGVLSKSLSGGVGESVTFLQSDMNDAVRASLQPYRNVIPV